MLTKIISTLVLAIVAVQSHAQTEIVLKYKDADTSYNLQGFEYRPAKWNGQVIVMNHGSTGGYVQEISKTYKFTELAKEATQAGFIFVTWMRKGRGGSEGIYDEESGKCNAESLKVEHSKAEKQLLQVLQQVRVTYKVNKVVLAGHSRGGFMSSMYATDHPDQVSAAINIAGVWSAYCEGKNSGYNRGRFTASADGFKNQYWVYTTRDPFFYSDKFNDENYEWFQRTASEAKIKFIKLKPLGFESGHNTAIRYPELWAPKILQEIKSHQ